MQKLLIWLMILLVVALIFGVSLIQAQCATWRCGTSIKVCAGGVNAGQSCQNSDDCPISGGAFAGCSTIGCGLPEFSEVSYSCSFGCPGDRCLVPGSSSCNCTSPTPPPPPPTSQPSANPGPACGNNGCGCYSGDCPPERNNVQQNNSAQCGGQTLCCQNSCGGNDPSGSENPACVEAINTPEPPDACNKVDCHCEMNANGVSWTGTFWNPNACNPCPSCSVGLYPNPATVRQGQPVTLTAGVSSQNGYIERVDYLSGNTTYVTVTPGSDTVTPYTTQAVAGPNLGDTTIQAQVIMGNGGSSDSGNGPQMRCQSTADITVLPPAPWWQVAGSGVTAVGNVASSVTVGKQFVLDPPGVVVAGGGSASMGSGTTSSKNWVVANTEADISTAVLANYSYDDLERNLLGYLTPTSVSSPVNNLESQGAPINGVRYLLVEGDAQLAQNNPINLGANKVVLLVRGNVTIGNTINLTDNQGFLLVAASGNIIVADTVGSSSIVDPTTLTPHIEGLFLAGGTFATGGGSRQLRIDGSVSGMSGVTLGRTAISLEYPAEYFVFRPELTVFAPEQILKRNLTYEEVAP